MYCSDWLHCAYTNGFEYFALYFAEYRSMFQSSSGFPNPETILVGNVNMEVQLYRDYTKIYTYILKMFTIMVIYSQSSLNRLENVIKTHVYELLQKRWPTLKMFCEKPPLETKIPKRAKTNEKWGRDPRNSWNHVKFIPKCGHILIFFSKNNFFLLRNQIAKIFQIKYKKHV